MIPKLDVIYEPKGKAREYAALALNMYAGCTHGCEYCWAPLMLHVKKEEFHRVVLQRENIQERTEKDLKKIAGHKDEILLCFTCDPYPPQSENGLTRRILLLMEKYKMKVTVLTKAGSRAIRDFDILKRNDWSFGTSLCFFEDEMRKKWEPEAASVGDRMNAIERAKENGIRTWMSIEPVVDAKQALGLLALLTTEKTSKLFPLIDHFKLGKLNYDKELEAKINWKTYLEGAKLMIEYARLSYYVKEDLKKAAGV